ncbi:hypothetical protein LC55x_2244 [Lysobacter capsici]|nr:hypothetical protein LC55x_2244 [Lysobacter capsici]
MVGSPPRRGGRAQASARGCQRCWIGGAGAPTVIAIAQPRGQDGVPPGFLMRRSRALRMRADSISPDKPGSAY